MLASRYEGKRGKVKRSIRFQNHRVLIGLIIGAAVMRDAGGI
jgi:hypothetical protein